MIHSVDSYKLIKTINYESEKANRVVDCLLQFHIASEETKYGFSMDEVIAMISTPEFSKLDSVKICGVMGIATFTDDENLIRKSSDTLQIASGN